MHPIKNFFFLGGSLLYLLIQIFRYFAFPLPSLINGYLTDFLFPILLFLFTLWLLRIIKRDNQIKLTNLMLIVGCVFVSVVFEFFLPLKNGVYVADKLDVIMYSLGTFSFSFLQKKFL